VTAGPASVPTTDGVPEVVPEIVHARSEAAPPGAERGGIGRVWAGWPGRVARIVFAVLPMVWVARQVHLPTVLARAAQVGLRGLGLSLLCTAGAFAVGAWRWRLVMRAYGADRVRIPQLGTLLRYYFVSQYFAVLPTGVAGDAVRAHRVRHCFEHPRTSYVALFVERLSGLVGLLLVAGAALQISPVLAHGPVAYALDVGLALAVAFGTLAIALPEWTARHPRLRAAVARIPIVGSVLARIPPAQSYALLGRALLGSVATQVLVVLSIIVILTPLSAAATLRSCAFVVPAIILVTYIPLTPGGLGQREAAFVQLFALVHVEREAALAASLLYFSTLLAVSAAGGLALLYERARGSS